MAPVSAVHLRSWLVDAAGGLAGERGADVALRVELDPLDQTPVTTPDDDSDEVDGPVAVGRSPGAHSPGGAPAHQPRRVEPGRRRRRSLSLPGGGRGPVRRRRRERPVAGPAPGGARLGPARAAAPPAGAHRPRSRRRPPRRAAGRRGHPPAGHGGRGALAGRDPGRRPRAARLGRDRPGRRRGSRFRPEHARRVPLAGDAPRRAALRGGDRPAGRGEAGARSPARPLGGRRPGAARAPEGPSSAAAHRRPRLSARSSPARSTSTASAVAVVADGPLAELADRLAAITGAPEGELGVPARARRSTSSSARTRPVGSTWLHAMVDAGLGGCLADDMGLGKTLQVIALHLHRAAAKAEDRRS